MHPVSDLQLDPTEPLTQVVFVHDYVQLVFDTDILSVYNPMTFRGSQGAALEQGQIGFADALLGLIGAKASSVETSQVECLALQFESKGRLAVRRATDESARPEAFQFNSEAGRVVVQQNV
jgi:hypothetical protein